MSVRRLESFFNTLPLESMTAEQLDRFAPHVRARRRHDADAPNGAASLDDAAPFDPEMANGHYASYDHYGLMTQQPPRRLPTSILQRSLCVVGALVVLLFVACVALRLVEAARSYQILRGFASHHFPHRGDQLPRPPLTAVLQRFKTLRRARPPATGVDPAALHAVFPHWRNADAALPDVALAIAALAQHLEQSDG